MVVFINSINGNYEKTTRVLLSYNKIINIFSIMYPVIEKELYPNYIFFKQIVEKHNNTDNTGFSESFCNIIVAIRNSLIVTLCKLTIDDEIKKNRTVTLKAILNELSRIRKNQKNIHYSQSSKYLWDNIDKKISEINGHKIRKQLENFRNWHLVHLDGKCGKVYFEGNELISYAELIIRNFKEIVNLLAKDPYFKKHFKEKEDLSLKYKEFNDEYKKLIEGEVKLIEENFK